MKYIFRNSKLEIRNSGHGRRGFAVLFTVLISAIILAITIGISSISFQEVALSSLAREGATSFFAADTGAECALYADIEWDTFNPLDPNNTGGYMYCGSNELQVSADVPFYLSLNNNKHCALVTVFKNDPTVTKIESLGYNVSCAAVQAQTGGGRMVERALRVTYEGSGTGGGGGGSCNFNNICEAGEDDISCVSDCGA